ncbi:MAG TPA: DUF5677 domain-containing protein [bacterium]
MIEAEYKALIDRDKTLVEFNTHFQQLGVMLRDMVNYGTQLIPRCFVSSGRKLPDAIAIGVLLRQIIAMLDGFEVQLSSGSLYSSSLQARSIFETSLLAEWLLSSDTEKKAHYYYVANLRRDRIWALRTVDGTPERDYFLTVMKGFGLNRNLDSEEARSEGRRALDEVNDILSLPEFKSIDAEFEKQRRPPKFIEPFWYKAYGVPSIRSIAEGVGKLHEYEHYYTLLSQATHAGSYKSHLSFADGSMRFEPVRSFENLNELCSLTGSVVIRTFKLYLDVYRGGEPAFVKKYAQDWRPVFMNIPKVTYTDAGGGPNI